jgi:glucose-6-phosphate isomerase, archaeal
MFSAPFAATFDWSSGVLRGETVHRSSKTLGQMRGLFRHGATSALPDDTLLYSVQWVAPGAPQANGALLFGCTHLEPGRVGDEYFMTHGHFHALSSRAEFYLPVSGSGVLLLMTRGGETWAEEMIPGKVLHIDGAHAHRAVNTGAEPLVFWACWPADAGYDYVTIAERGFGLRVVEHKGRTVLADQQQ